MLFMVCKSTESKHIGIYRYLHVVYAIYEQTSIRDMKLRDRDSGSETETVRSENETQGPRQFKTVQNE